MNTYNIPRNVKGEGRILFIFSTKALIYTAIGCAIGLIFYIIFSLLKIDFVGIVFVVALGLVGFIIGTFKIPNSENFKFTKKTGGENIDDIIKRAIMFKKNKKIYLYTIEEKEMVDKQTKEKGGNK